MIKFNINNYYINQDLSIPSPFIRYVIVNMDSENLKKLYKTCKYFYACFKINIIDDLYFSKKSDISAFCINEHLKDLQLEGFPKTINAFGLHTSQLNQLPGNLWLTGEIALFDISNLSPLFSKIIRCDLFGAFIATDMTINEFAFLTHSQTIKRIYVTGKIYSSNKKTEVAPLEDILLHLLSADYLRFDECFVTQNTMQKLMLLNFREKLNGVGLWNINQMLDANLMNEFLLKSLEDKARVQFVFKSRDNNRIFLSQMHAKINAWIPEERKPQTFPYTFIFRQ